MAAKKESGRQDVLVGKCEFTYADLTSGAYEAMVDVPPGAIVIGGFLAITTLFNSGTEDKFKIGKKVGSAAAVPAAYAAQTANITVTGRAATITPDGVEFTSKGSVGIEWAGTGAAATAGVGVLVVEYILADRVKEVQPA
jgi:hypothetical protein